MVTPSLDEVMQFAAKGYRRIPLSMEIDNGQATPIEVLKKLKYVSAHCYLLESAKDNQKRGRYSFLGYDPQMEISCTDRLLTIKAGAAVTVETNHPEEVLRRVITDNICPKIDGLPPFSGGLVGYFSYDYIKYTEPSLSINAIDREGFKDFDLMLFDKVVAFDHKRKKIVLIVNIRCDEPESAYHKGERELNTMEELLKRGRSDEKTDGVLKSPLRPLFDREHYGNIVKKAKEYIREGDIFQVVLSNCFEAQYEGSLLHTYRTLRDTNPSPYMFYFSGDEMEIAGASPETLVKLKDGVLYTFPLAGTRPRGKTKAEDERLAHELLADDKEKAEHNMLVDLGRNDIGKISKFNSVNVTEYMNILSFSHVMHIGSTVRGLLRKDCDALDAIAAVLPAGTLSGAPKIRACEIIDELENNKRGLYGGAIGYIDFSGNLDMCIAIRVAYQKNHKVFVRSGAGIVADSIPAREYEECLHKAKAVVNALESVNEGVANGTSNR